MKNEKEDLTGKQYWTCIIGPVDNSELPQGSDAPPRSAAQNAVIEMIGRQPECWSGWGTSQDRFERIMDVWNSETPATRMAEQSWLLVEEMPLPPSGRVLATLQRPRNAGTRVVILNVAEKPWKDVTVIAWMPLPEDFSPTETNA